MIILKVLGAWLVISTLVGLVAGRYIALGQPAEMPYCPQCTDDSTLEELHENEGYCRACCRANQRELIRHYAEHDRWEGLTDQQREAEIRRAM